MTKPKISIIIPAYNSELFIEEAIDSALSQTWGKKEVIVVDDGSTDKTYQKASKYKKYGVTVLRQKNLGACAARNNGIMHSTGDYIQLLDSDDILTKDKIEKQVKYIKPGENQITFCNAKNFYDFNKTYTIKNPKYPEILELKDLIYKYLVFTPTTLIPKEIFKKTGLFNTRLKRAQEHELNVRIASLGYKFKSIDFYGVLVRHHKSPFRISNLDIKGTVSNDLYLLKLFSEYIARFNVNNEILWIELIKLAISKAQQYGNIKDFNSIKLIENFINTIKKEHNVVTQIQFKESSLYNYLLNILGLKFFEILRYYFLTKHRDLTNSNY